MHDCMAMQMRYDIDNLLSTCSRSSMFLALLLLLFMQTCDSIVDNVLFIITTPICSRSSSFLALLLLFLQPHSSTDATILFIVVAFIVVYHILLLSCCYKGIFNVSSMWLTYFFKIQYETTTFITYGPIESLYFCSFFAREF